ncbi:MAG TPA: hypothetical protein PK177_04450 [Burkholderiaceae bacterium]|nr:hypothetical protein [Burkholderiaceae bacterium]
MRVNYTNGDALDRQGRLISSDHAVAGRVMRAAKDGMVPKRSQDSVQ